MPVTVVAAKRQPTVVPATAVAVTKALTAPVVAAAAGRLCSVTAIANISSLPVAVAAAVEAQAVVPVVAAVVRPARPVEMGVYPHPAAAARQEVAERLEPHPVHQVLIRPQAVRLLEAMAVRALTMRPEVAAVVAVASMAVVAVVV
jgi:hypothetical protein